MSHRAFIDEATTVLAQLATLERESRELGLPQQTLVTEAVHTARVELAHALGMVIEHVARTETGIAACPACEGTGLIEMGPQSQALCPECHGERLARASSW